MGKKYGVKVPMAKDDYIWVTEPSKEDGLGVFKPILFTSFEDAQEAADIWGPLAVVEEYQPEEA